MNDARFVALWLDPLDLGLFTEAVAAFIAAAAAVAVGLFNLPDQKNLLLREGHIFHLNGKGTGWSIWSRNTVC